MGENRHPFLRKRYEGRSIAMTNEERLYANRQSGDYDAFIMMDEDTVKEFYPRAVSFIDTIEQLIKQNQL